MNKLLNIVLVVLVIAGLISFVGCKKTETSPPPTTTNGTKPPVDANNKKPVIPPKPTTDANAKIPTTASSLTSGALDTIPIADVRAAIAKMGVDGLKAKALEYKNVIHEKAVENTKAVLALRDIPVAELAFGEGKALMDKNAALSKMIPALKERYQLYIDKIVELGGDVSGLKLEE
jgi:hypothetical protein